MGERMKKEKMNVLLYKLREREYENYEQAVLE